MWRVVGRRGKQAATCPRRQCRPDEAEAEEEDEAEDEGKGGDARGISPTSSPSPPRRSRAPPEKAQIARWPGWSSLFGTLLANDDQAVHRLAALCEQNLNASFSNSDPGLRAETRLRSRFARTGCEVESVLGALDHALLGQDRSATGAEQGCHALVALGGIVARTCAESSLKPRVRRAVPGRGNSRRASGPTVHPPPISGNDRLSDD